MKNMELESVEKVRQYVCKKFFDIFDGEYELPKYQDMDDIQTEYITKDVDTRAFVDQGIFGLLTRENDNLVYAMDKIEQFYEKLQSAISKYSDSPHIKELKKIVDMVEEKINKNK